jgi:WD40 repeat protein
MMANIWDISSGQPIKQLSGHRKVVSSLALSDDGDK